MEHFFLSPFLGILTTTASSLSEYFMYTTLSQTGYAIHRYAVAYPGLSDKMASRISCLLGGLLSMDLLGLRLLSDVKWLLSSSCKIFNMLSKYLFHTTSCSLPSVAIAPDSFSRGRGVAKLYLSQIWQFRLIPLKSNYYKCYWNHTHFLYENLNYIIWSLVRTEFSLLYVLIELLSEISSSNRTGVMNFGKYISGRKPWIS